MAKPRHLPTYLPKVLDEDRDTCARCGGQCCKHLPGSTHPSEWGKTKEEIGRNAYRALMTGRWSVDHWDGDPRPEMDGDEKDYLSEAVYLTPSTQRNAAAGNVEITGFSVWGGACTFHGEEGCQLPSLDRPIECRGLVPRKTPTEHCNARELYQKRANAIAWIPFQDVLNAALQQAKKDRKKLASEIFVFNVLDAVRRGQPIVRVEGYFDHFDVVDRILKEGLLDRGGPHLALSPKGEEMRERYKRMIMIVSMGARWREGR